MNDPQPVLVFLCVLPGLYALVALGVFSFARKAGKDPLERKLGMVLKMYLGLLAFNWAGRTGSMWAPESMLGVNVVMWATFLLVPVLLYHYVHIITRNQGEQEFSKWHYLFPLILFTGILGWFIQAPSGVILQSLYPALPLPAGYEYFGGIMHSKQHVQIGYVLVYNTLVLLRIFRYRKEAVNYSAETDKNTLDWLLLFAVLALVQLVCLVIPLNFSSGNTLVYWWAGLTGTLYFVQLPLLAFYTVKRKYVIMSGLSAVEPEDAKRPHSQKVTRRKFEEYMRIRKPYLQADLKITDLCGQLHTNRSYLSNFINTTYGMSFSQFINNCRLRELDLLLQKLPVHTLHNNIDLIFKAGFGSYDSYRRAKKMHEKETTLLS